ncbi:MAG TPA: SAM-dependent methyltransferase [Candidatus Obscuribacterales bacterium]
MQEDQIQQDQTQTIRIEIQAPVPYEQSLLWTLHREYYQQQGLQAFLRHEVPYNISSNPCLAGNALRLLLAAENVQNKAAPAETVHVLEIGAGLGIFASNFLQALTEMAPGLELCYWLSDYSAAGLQALAEHPAFAPWCRSGRLRLCLIDGRDPGQARDLEDRPLELPGFSLILANYVFSTLPTAVLLRQQDQWLSQQTRLEWLPLGPEPEVAALEAFAAQLAGQLRGYRLVDRVSPSQESYPMFQALQQAQEQVATQLEAGLLPAGDFSDWLSESLATAWAAALQRDPDDGLRQTVVSLLSEPLLSRNSYPPEQLHESHSFAATTAAEIFADPLHRQAVESLTNGWPLVSLGYSPTGLEALSALLGLCRPGGLLLLSDKAYADTGWMRGLQPEMASRHGQSLAHPVNFPLFEACLGLQGKASLRTTDPAQALHSLLVCHGPELPQPVAGQFIADFIDYPRNEISHALLEGGHALMQLERLEQAQRCLQRALGYRPADGTLQYLSAVCLLNQERYTEALEVLERPHDDLFGLFNREILQAESYRLTGRPELALPLYRASLRHGENSQTYYNLALCQLELAQRQDAVTSLQQAAGLDPDDSEIQELLAALDASD